LDAGDWMKPLDVVYVVGGMIAMVVSVGFYVLLVWTAILSLI
jgi:hypothetical protein